MTKGEQQVIRNVIARLKRANCGCSNPLGTEDIVASANDLGLEVVMRLYLDSWIIPALELIVESENSDGPDRDMRTALELSR